MSSSKSPLNFDGQKFFIGLDVHKKNWTVTIRSLGIELTTFSMNPSPGFDSYRAKFLKKAPIRAWPSDFGQKAVGTRFLHGYLTAKNFFAIL